MIFLKNMLAEFWFLFYAETNKYLCACAWGKG